MTFILFVDVLREKNIKLQNKKEREKKKYNNKQNNKNTGPRDCSLWLGGSARDDPPLLSLSLSPPSVF